MNRSLVVLVTLLIVAGLVPAAAQTDGPAKLIAPPAIYLPAGGKVVTEINLSDADVLGIVKEAIPAAAEVVQDIASQHDGSGGETGRMVAMAGMVDLGQLSEAIDGIKNVRVLVARYPRPIDPAKFITDFSAGVAKAGPFNKILSDFGTFPGAVALYALPDNGGCIGFAYNPSEQTVYAMRVVGGVDVPKLIKWAGGIAKMAINMRTAVSTEPQAVQPEKQKCEQPPAADENEAPQLPAESN